MDDQRTLQWKQYTIREATPADLEIVLAQRRKMFLAIGRSDDERLAETMQNSRAFFSDRFRTGKYHAWLVENKTGEVVAGAGVITFDYPSSPRDPSPQRPMVVNVYTERIHRRKGIAKQLMEIIIGWCRTKGFRSIMLHASDDGRPLYEALGFKPTNEMRLMLD